MVNLLYLTIEKVISSLLESVRDDHADSNFENGVSYSGLGDYLSLICRDFGLVRGVVPAAFELRRPIFEVRLTSGAKRAHLPTSPSFGRLMGHGRLGARRCAIFLLSAAAC